MDKDRSLAHDVLNPPLGEGLFGLIGNAAAETHFAVRLTGLASPPNSSKLPPW
jgi:hypothetical protein